jgi:hypothetical protein
VALSDAPIRGGKKGAVPYKWCDLARRLEIKREDIASARYRCE